LRKNPASHHIVTRTGDDADIHDLAMRKAALLMDATHDDGGLKKCVMGRTVKTEAAAGSYWPDSE